jgi:Leucine-rich repeat (LRR) protein
MSIIDYTITELNLSFKGLNKLPDDINKYTNLIKLDCSSNLLTSLDNLPHNLQYLNCCNNQLTSLDNLPYNLQKLYCSYNKLTNLDNLPIKLQYLFNYGNQFKYDFEPTLENIKKYNASRIQ